MQSNMWKIFIYIFTGRRNFFILIAILYLTFPGSSVLDLWYFVALGTAATFLIEIPSGYISDLFWYKKTLIIGKVAMVLSTLCYIVGQTFRRFALGNIFFSVASAFRSGTLQAFVHDTLESLGKWGQYGKIMSKMRGDVSLLSVAFILLYPVLYGVWHLLPFYLALAVDLVWLITAFTLIMPVDVSHASDEKEAYRSMRGLIWEFFRSKLFLLVSVLTTLAWTLYLSHTSFRELFLMDIGYPVAFIWLVAGLSRFFWFIFGRCIWAMKETIGLRQLIAGDFLIMWIWFSLLGILSLNWYMMGLLFSLLMWYFFARWPLYTQHLIWLIPDKKYKATFLSIKSQLAWLFGMVIPVGIGYVMLQWYGIGFQVIGLSYLLVGIVGVLIYARLQS